jgi:transposase-like protein
MKKKYSVEEKIELVQAAIRNENSKSELCRQRGISTMSLDAWIKRFLEAGKAGLSGARSKNDSSGEEYARLQKENEQLRHELSERELDIRILKKISGQMTLTGEGSK